MRTLYLEKRGCDFSPGDTRVADSDIGNYRVTTTDYTVTGKNGQNYFIEICRATKWNTRTTHKVTGKPLKHPVRELVTENAAHVDAMFCDTDGCCWRDLNISHDTWNTGKPFPYTKQGILDLVNSFAAVPYDNIEFVAKRKEKEK